MENECISFSPAIPVSRLEFLGLGCTFVLCYRYDYDYVDAA